MRAGMRGVLAMRALPARLVGVALRALLAGVALVAMLAGVALAASGVSIARAASFSAHGSAEQIYVTGLAPRARMALLDARGRRIAVKAADSLGGLIFYNVHPGSGYRVRLLPHGAESGAITVHNDAPAPWDPRIYDQRIADSGYQYLSTRDGTKLAIDVHPPISPASLGSPGLTPPSGPVDYRPPYPTLIEYSGYAYADPSGPVNGIAVLANLMGFAVVDVNMRGTGCSGGAYDYFEPLQNLDAYDVIETIAHQPWVLDHRVGMIGISYGAISQLFAAQTDPPALEAISPLSTIDATATTLYPGGILNTGFAVPWALQRQQQAQPAGVGRTGTQAYAEQRIAQGDRTCKANQVLHGEATNLLATIRRNDYFRPRFADPLDPTTFVDRIHVPVFMACQWEDEQTGGHCADLVAHFTGTDRKWFFFTNGAHIDSLDPYTFDRWYDFLSLFVAHRAPILDAPLIHLAAPLIYQQAMGVDNEVLLPVDPIQQIPTYKGALTAFQRTPEVTVMFDNGAGRSPDGTLTPGDPYPAFVKGFSSFPIPGTEARFFYLERGGALGSRPPAHEQVDTYLSNARALPLIDYVGNTGGGGLWAQASAWEWDWRQYPHGSAVSYITAPLKSNTTVIGGGAVHLWLRASTPDVDLQATVSEVRPDGIETFVQNGWIRADERALSHSTDNEADQPSTLLEPVPTFMAKDARPLPRGRFVEVVIPLYFEGHVYRAGSRIRVTISAPNGTQPIWSFSQTVPRGTARVWVAFSRRMPSSLVLPVVTGVSVPTGLPPCPSLRNEPCRPYVPFVNEVGRLPGGRRKRHHQRSQPPRGRPRGKR
jgi:predicted acyl esterase